MSAAQFFCMGACCRHCLRDGDRTASCEGVENTHDSPCRFCDPQPHIITDQRYGDMTDDWEQPETKIERILDDAGYDVTQPWRADVVRLWTQWDRGQGTVTADAISQRISTLIKTDDWVVVHRGHELYDAEDMDRLEAGFIVRAPCTCTDRINPGCYIHDPEEES